MSPSESHRAAGTDRDAADTQPLKPASVLLPLPLAGAYDYLVPEGTQPGQLVLAPLGRSISLGVVWGDATGEVEAAKLRGVETGIDCPPLPPETRTFVDRVADYTVTPPGAVLRMCLSVSAALEAPAPRIAYRLADSVPERLTDARRRVLDVLRDGPPRSVADIAEAAGVGTGVVRGLIEAGALASVELPAHAPPPLPDIARPGPDLSDAQRAAAEELKARVAERAFSVTLIDGVTGSGKTEVYFEAIAAAIAAGRQVLVLLPEIALSAQWLKRFEARFGVKPTEWHSDLRSSERRRNWRQVATGEAHVVVGARSALFLPFPRLGLIVVDEEHDASFKQEDGVRYHARDMAVLRAQIGAFPAVLASATPSLETRFNVERGRYRAVHLPNRHGAAELPEIRMIDLRREPPQRGRWLSPSLTAAVQETLAAGEQALLFLNRRGYAPLTLCGACGHRLQCPNCSTWLVEHRFAGQLRCHHCGHETRPPSACPACGAEGRFKPCGPGIERLAEEAAALFPEARIATAASDLLVGPRAAEELVRRVLDREIDLLVGTQVLAKGHHFPLLTLVGVVDADLGLAGGDLRAAERTYQLLSQVAGRAGRAERPGRVLLQSYMPEAPVLQALVTGDVEGFIAAEMAARREAGMPPYGRLAALIVSGKVPEMVATLTRELARTAPNDRGLEVWGPAPAPLALLRGRHRQRFLIKADRGVRVQAALRHWLAPIKLRADLRIEIDIDPHSFL
jgi:primosomal protein N' (replication factor Y)